MEENNVKKTETVSVVGFIFAFLIPIIGLILTIIGLVKAKKNNSEKGLAIAGLVISIFHIVIRALIIGFVFLLIGVSTFRAGSIREGYSKMCSKAQVCEHAFGNYYNCSYKDNSVNYSIICNKDRIPEDVEKNEYRKELLEEAGSKYYTHIYDGLIESVDSRLSGNNVIIELNKGTSATFIIVVDKDTWVGVDSQGRDVDLTEYDSE